MEKAEQVESMNELDLGIKEALEETNEDPAPQVVESPEDEKPKSEKEEIEAKEPKQDGFQKRINKVTADKWEATRRAEAAEAKLAEMQQAQAPKVQSKEPALEDFNYDEQAFNSALIDYKVEIKAQSIQREQKDLQEQEAQAKTSKVFNQRSAEFAIKNEDFNEVLSRVPTLQPTVLQYVMEDPKGPELAYYLGSNEDIANKIAQMNPIAAAVEIGKISSILSEPKSIKTSSAPEPMESISSGGSITKKRGPKGATFE